MVTPHSLWFGTVSPQFINPPSFRKFGVWLFGLSFREDCHSYRAGCYRPSGFPTTISSEGDARVKPLTLRVPHIIRFIFSGFIQRYRRHVCLPPRVRRSLTIAGFIFFPEERCKVVCHPRIGEVCKLPPFFSIVIDSPVTFKTRVLSLQFFREGKIEKSLRHKTGERQFPCR